VPADVLSRLEGVDERRIQQVLKGCGLTLAAIFSVYGEFAGKLHQIRLQYIFQNATMRVPERRRNLCLTVFTSQAPMPVDPGFVLQRGQVRESGQVAGYR